MNDNDRQARGSVESFPFSSVNVYAYRSVHKVSSGNQQANGAIITVAPHHQCGRSPATKRIRRPNSDSARGDQISTGGDNPGLLPPQRKIDRVGSVVTIPDGKTVVVGGLKRGSTSEAFSGVPWIEKIPVLRELTSKTTTEDKCTSFFLFIRPKILRDSQFRDLQYLSGKDIREMEIPANEPVSRPMLIPCENLPIQHRALPYSGQSVTPELLPTMQTQESTPQE